MHDREPLRHDDKAASRLAPNDMSVSDASWRGAAAKHFKGEIIVGHDLMVI